jgi:hypothetical protein
VMKCRRFTADSTPVFRAVYVGTPACRRAYPTSAYDLDTDRYTLGKRTLFIPYPARNSLWNAREKGGCLLPIPLDLAQRCQRISFDLAQSSPCISVSGALYRSAFVREIARDLSCTQSQHMFNQAWYIFMADCIYYSDSVQCCPAKYSTAVACARGNGARPIDYGNKFEARA